MHHIDCSWHYWEEWIKKKITQSNLIVKWWPWKSQNNWIHKRVLPELEDFQEFFKQTLNEHFRTFPTDAKPAHGAKYQYIMGIQSHNV